MKDGELWWAWFPVKAYLSVHEFNKRNGQRRWVWRQHVRFKSYWAPYGESSTVYWLP